MIIVASILGTEIQGIIQDNLFYTSTGAWNSFVNYIPYCCLLYSNAFYDKLFVIKYTAFIYTPCLQAKNCYGCLVYRCLVLSGYIYLQCVIFSCHHETRKSYKGDNFKILRLENKRIIKIYRSKKISKFWIYVYLYGSLLSLQIGT